jgi:lipopolysaccharide transport system ATP-binding protein
MSEIAIRIENLSKRYRISTARNRHDTLKDQLSHVLQSVFGRTGHSGRREDIWVLRDLWMQVCQGELVGVVGRNGAGKSTLLKILSRITEPTKGRYEIRGRVSSLLEVGTGFHPELTGRENIFLNGAILGMRKKEISRKFDEIVAFAETEKFIDTPVKRYSSGMYVRLAFAVAAHLEPEILLVDEVLAVGDAAFQKKCLGKMGDVARQGRTVIFVSHNMVAVNSLCERAIWLDGGRLAADGPSEDVVAKYLMESGRNGNSLEEVWDEQSRAPGNGIVRIHRVRLDYLRCRESDPLTMQTPFRVSVEYWNLVDGAHLHVGLVLYTEQGLVAFSTDSFGADWGDRAMPVGLYRSVCHFPGNLLNSGHHRFAVVIAKDIGSIVLSHDSLSFDVLDLKKRNGAFHGRRAGVVQPQLKWETTCAEEEDGMGREKGARRIGSVRK